MWNGKRCFAILFGLLIVSCVDVCAEAADQLYAPPAADEVKSSSLQWFAGRRIKDHQVAFGKIWAIGDESPSARMLFDKVIETFRLGDPETKVFVDACALRDAPLLAPKSTLLSRKNDGEFFQANLQLYYGRYLAQRKMYDEALEILTQLNPKQVVDPATCLFFRAVCQHQLLMKQAGLATIELLLKNTEDVPVSYSTVATLMQYELQALKDKSLDQVSRKMKDSGRRLDLARGGQKVQKVQDEIVTLLDEIIEKMEQQSGGGGGGGGAPNPSNLPSGSPAQDSIVKGAKAPGNVDRKNVKREAGWGALPPKQEARAKNLLNRNFPAHYRRAVEEYLKKLAGRRAQLRKQP